MAQRLRLTYAKTGALAYVAHLDLVRAWERAFRRARLPLAYSQGYSPHARLSLGAPLPVGAEGTHELLDVWMDPRVAPADAERALRAVLPVGLTVITVEEISEAWPALQATTSTATFRVTLDPTALDVAVLGARIAAFLALDTLPWEDVRADRTRQYDLRAAVHTLTLEAASAADERLPVLEMTLALNATLTGRTDAVLAALEIRTPPLRVIRTAITLADQQPAAAQPTALP